MQFKTDMYGFKKFEFIFFLNEIKNWLEGAARI